MRPAHRSSDPGCNGPDQYDAAIPLPDHDGFHRLANQERAFEIDVQEVVPIILCDFRSVLAVPDATEIYEKIDTAKPLDGLGHNFGAALRLGKIERQREHIRSQIG